MTKSLTQNDLVQQILKKDSCLPLTSRELAEQIYIQYPEYCQKKMKKNPRTADKDSVCRQISAQINAQVRALEKKFVFSTTERPRKFYFERPENKTSVPLTISQEKHREEKEKALYPKLIQYCKNILGIYALRIDDKKKEKGRKNENIWRYADIVGFQDLTIDFHPTTKKCLIEYSAQRSYLYSFEVKDGEIDISSLREAFFQTVSNSSWANYSYLVAEGIKDEKTKQELELLCESFKIGFIKLNKEVPEDSEIIIQAPETELDWNMMNRIAIVSTDFRDFLQKITSTYKAPEASEDIWNAKER